MNERLLFLGDIHGNFSVISQYIKLYNINNAHIIQVGDFGVGFNTVVKEKRMLETINDKLVENNVHVWAIRGNHDYKPHFDKDPFELSNIHLVPDYTILEICDKRILCIGGAVSVDRRYRYTSNQRKGIFDKHTLGVERWWPDEKFILDREKLGQIRDINIVVTHTSPSYCEKDNTFGFGPLVESFISDGDNELKNDLTIERNQLDDAFVILKLNNEIKIHTYGHFHSSWESRADGYIHKTLNRLELSILTEDFIDISSLFDNRFWAIYTRNRKNRKSQTTVGLYRKDVCDLFRNKYNYQNKSIECPNFINEIDDKLLHYFIRGYFDGDGCFYSSKDFKQRQCYLCGDFNQDWFWIEEIFKKLDIEYTIKKKSQTTGKYSIVYIKRKSIDFFGNYIYNGYLDDKLGIKRKYSKFINHK